ncbi:MAG TPA: succinate dehydrogenase/fumarate reductase iron-sulfur subunit [Bdellovibrionota bacterium]|jgi:succinate dehydrogenase / fumarate reductase iron-sulfur subunit|nr:succinate dehydrogenase/fumarate reductase iron-sulfur subunit [Bdellovibrionota bacterium]
MGHHQEETTTSHGSKKNLNLKLKVWRQESGSDKGALKEYQLSDVSPDMSFLEMLDVLNQKIIKDKADPVAFDHDCREGICGACSLVINGAAHGPEKGTTTCQLHMRHFSDGDTIVIEPFRAQAFPVIKDLVVDRSAFDRIIQAGGYVSVNTGNPQDANSLPIKKEDADLAFAAAACIGCGACVAACKNASAMLFVGAKVSHLYMLPQGEPEREKRVLGMVNQMDEEGFGACTVTGSCEAACPKEIKLENIARLNREYTRATLRSRK